ncbi:MAG: helix-turn-helix domain-containing protein, partial [Acidobacteriaceae bacterium]|nr:helix-turn-helix domain-containing protein [Acidobacteriaceae bacterium]
MIDRGGNTGSEVKDQYLSMLTMYQQITILTLHKQGVKQAEIAKKLGCHRNTIRNVVRRKKPIEKLS